MCWVSFFVRLVFVVLFCFSKNYFFAQTSKGILKQLTKSEVNGIFSKEELVSLQINLTIQSAYTYTDSQEQKLLVFTESNDSIGLKKDTCNFKIKAMGLVKQNESWKKLWEVNDFILRSQNETSIWFWTKYLEANDFDKDSKPELYLVYGTNGMNGLNDGRLKFVVVKDDKKYVVRLQSGVLDFERNLQIDKTFYELPSSIQKRVNEIMNLTSKNQNIIFPFGWENGMTQKKTKISER